VELNKDEYVMLQGKRHPLYRGVLRLAGESGLKKLAVRLIQAPSAENGGSAICEAVAIFRSPDGQEREFVEIGDCDGSNCGKMIAPHRVRMAATRAKGRALRDALGIGEALIEELGGPSASEEPIADPEVHDYPCCQCGADVPWDQVKASRRKFNSKVFCSRCAANFSDPKTEQHWCDTCGAEIVKTDTASVALIVDVSQKRFGRTLCLNCGRSRMEMEKANLPQGAISG